MTETFFRIELRRKVKPRLIWRRPWVIQTTEPVLLHHAYGGAGLYVEFPQGRWIVVNDHSDFGHRVLRGFTFEPQVEWIERKT